MSTITLSPETEKLLSERMQAGGHGSADEAVRATLLVLNDVELGSAESLDAQTLDAIQEANQQIDRGEGMPIEEAFAKLRQKHLGE